MDLIPMEKLNINWYPGHMAKTRREMAERLSAVDLVAEILDARIPGASRNRMLDELTRGKPRLLVLNRTDLAAPEGTRLWTAYYREKGFGVVTCDAKSGAGVKDFLPAAHRMLEEKYRKLAEKGQTGRRLTCMVVGVPNVGKSSFINKLAGRRAAKTEDRPGVTRDMKLIPLDAGLSLLDTPGMLMPKIESDRQGFLLAFTGALRDDVMDVETLAANLILTLADAMPEGLFARYKVGKGDAETGYGLLELAARKRGFLISGGEGDTERAARILLDEFRGGKLGRATLEKPGEDEDEKD
ncbi:MAG: ribosome biogenesis GTPase YlqF [Clostridia bacterium]|nr:ribosome biogenesis GTPase YlqF [Clostridia bacterium]